MRLLYTDLHGVARGKDIPIGHFVELLEEGVAFCAAVMGTDLRHTPVVGGEEGYVDFAIRPDLDTLRVVPWQPEVAWCLGEAWRLDGSDHWPSCPRALLARVVGRYATRGLLPIVGPELEWFLCERDPTAPAGSGRYVDELSRVYTVGAISDPRQINLKMLLWADELGLKAYAGNHEFMNSQYEINVKHSGGARRGRPRLHAQGGGEGDRGDGGPRRDVHGHGRSPTRAAPASISTSRSPTADGRNAFASEEAAVEPARPAVHRRRASSTRRGCRRCSGPTVNAYKRILPDSLAPTHANWGHDNRTAFCRVPNERGSRTRVEVRTGDGSACAHLITAALLLAGLDGIERELEPPEPVVGDAYRMDDAHAGTKLPADLGAALDALEADTWLVEQLGSELVSTFVAMKRFEVERFTEAVGALDLEVVSEWEVEEYASHL